MSESWVKPFTGLEKEALICGGCGYCRNACPVYHVIGWESAGPRGKMAAAKEIFSLGSRNELPEEFVQRMAQCTLCGACAGECSTAIDTRKTWLELRKRIVERTSHGTAKKISSRPAKSNSTEYFIAKEIAP